MSQRDLVVLVADQDMRNVLMQVLKRPQALGIRTVESLVVSESRHDPACAKNGVQVLARYENEFNHALLVFDHEGSGRERESPEEIEAGLDAEFARTAWGQRGRAVVVSPELEVWLWGGSPHVDKVIGWAGRKPSLRQWMLAEGWWPDGAAKPLRPKEAFQAAAHKGHVPARARIFQDIASQVSLRRCSDRAFLRLRDTLRAWFPRAVP